MGVRSRNKQALLQCLRSYGETSAKQLAEILQLPEMLILDLAEELKSSNFIKETSPAGDDLDRMFALDLEYYLVMGIDVTTIGEVNAVLCDIKGNIVSSTKKTYPVTPIQPDSAIFEAVEELQEYAETQNRNLVGIGLAIAGLVNPFKRKVLYSNRIEFLESSLWDDLVAQTGLPVFIESEANAVSLVQWERVQAITRLRSLMCVSIGQNIDAGIIQKGDIYYGDLLSSGLVGHIVVEPDGKECICGQRGCLDTVVERDAKTGLIHANATGRYLGHALGVFANMYNINYIIISAHEPLSDVFWQEVSEAFTAHTIPFMREKTTLHRSLIEENSVSLGAATVVLYKLYSFSGAVLPEQTTASDAHNNKIIQRMQLFIQENYRIDISLTDVADYLQMNPQYISRLFKSVTGENFLYYLNSIRIENSKKLMENTNYTMADISKIVGFTNVQRFSRFFKKIEGCSPGRWKELRTTEIVK